MLLFVAYSPFVTQMIYIMQHDVSYLKYKCCILRPLLLLTLFKRMLRSSYECEAPTYVIQRSIAIAVARSHHPGGFDVQRGAVEYSRWHSQWYVILTPAD